jgi:hypothetical protein
LSLSPGRRWALLKAEALVADVAEPDVAKPNVAVVVEMNELVNVAIELALVHSFSSCGITLGSIYVSSCRWASPVAHVIGRQVDRHFHKLGVR